jgi:hypothetical protein
MAVPYCSEGNSDRNPPNQHPISPPPELVVQWCEEAVDHLGRWPTGGERISAPRPGRRSRAASPGDGVMEISNQRLRNLTTLRLHTCMGDIYSDLELITGEQGLMTHMLPRVSRAIEPWLRRHVPDPRFWDGEHDPTHDGTTELPEPSAGDRHQMLQVYLSQPDPLAGKDVLVVKI